MDRKSQKFFLVELSKSHYSMMEDVEIRKRIESRKLSVDKRIFIEAEELWVKIVDTHFVENSRREWHYLNEGQPVGVFSDLEIIRMVQQKRLQPTQLLWKPGMKDWVEFCRLVEFSPRNLRKLVHEHPSLRQSIFSRRVSPRINFQADFLLHDETKIWKGESFEIGLGGVGIQVQNSELKIGQELQLHLLSSQTLQNFSARVQIVSHLKDIKSIRPDRFGLKFIEIEENIQKKIEDYVEKHVLKIHSA